VRVLVIDNPRSGQGDAGLYAFVRELVARGAEVVVRPMPPGVPPPELLGDAASFQRVVSGGGDGTTSTLAYALRDSGLPILAYPAGTANLLPLNLGLPYDPAALARLTLEGPVRKTDLGEITVGDEPPVGFAIMAGAGFDAAVMQGAAELKSTLGVGAYFLSVMGNLMPTVADFRIWLDGELLATDGIAVIVVNFAKIQFDLSVTHESDATDGLLEVAVIRTRHVAGLIPTVWQALLDRLGTMPERSGLEIHQAREIRVESEPPLPLQYDGEYVGTQTPFSARVLSGAATFVMPEEP
jgi:diacylglycerol kinase family enzyme